MKLRKICLAVFLALIMAISPLTLMATDLGQLQLPEHIIHAGCCDNIFSNVIIYADEPELAVRTYNILEPIFYADELHSVQPFQLCCGGPIIQDHVWIIHSLGHSEQIWIQGVGWVWASRCTGCEIRTYSQAPCGAYRTHIGSRWGACGTMVVR